MRIKTILVIVLFLGVGMTLLGQDTVTVNVTIRGVTVFVLDGTDVGGKNPTDYNAAETCDFGTLDAAGGAITGGDASVTGTLGIPVDSSGADLGVDGVYDPTCVGSFYPFFAADVPAPNNNDHAAAALGIYMHITGISTYSLDVAASVAGDPSVTVGQLKWKTNAGAASGYTGYTDFIDTGSTTITSGSGNLAPTYLFHDYGLLVEFADVTGAYTWTVTYTLTTT
jgi:hypothetical protein